MDRTRIHEGFRLTQDGEAEPEQESERRPRTYGRALLRLAAEIERKDRGEPPLRLVS